MLLPRRLYAVMILLTLACPPVSLAASAPIIQRSFDTPIDAMSVRLPMQTTTLRYAALVQGSWTPWQDIENDGDSLPGEESELIMLPRGTTVVRVQGLSSSEAIHPIRVSEAPTHVALASLTLPGGTTVLTRQEWGADESLLFQKKTAAAPSGSSDTGKGDNGGGTTGQSDQRVSDCQTAQQLYPLEFQSQRGPTTDINGRTYRWAPEYMAAVKLLVVHHTAIQASGDPRPPAERVRALYQYHAENRGWGDIGYHYLIDEKGTIYQGRTGGRRVVGGHAYCNNIGTIGIALLGNFEVEQPSLAQAKALQRLLSSLADTEGIDLSRAVTFHGKRFESPIVGHRDLMSTACPGRILAAAMSQIRSNILEKKLDNDVVFPAVTSPSAPGENIASSPSTAQAEGIRFIGRTVISMVPGGMQRLSFSYTAGIGGAYQGKKVAAVSLSSPAIALWVDDGVHRIPVSKGILLPYDLPAGETLQFQLIVQAPMEEGSYRMSIGGIDFEIPVSGRRARTGTFTNPFSGNATLEVRPKDTPKSSAPLGFVGARRRRERLSVPTSKTPASSRSSAASSSASSVATDASIRIRLTIDASTSIFFPDGGFANDVTVTPGTTYSLLLRSGRCVLDHRGTTAMEDGLLRLRSRTTTPLAVTRSADTRSYQGVLECRVVDGALALINELPLEIYMEGLAEEPDSEPYEKQRAFAIAARTYAAYYMLPANRKFPGKPYDGSDDPAIFQAYHGVLFADRNPFWVKAVRATAGQVMTYKGSLIKPPYFSSDDGRTRSPSEAGWNNFPASEILQSKDDPWCKGLPLRGHGVGMSGCGALGQAKEGKSAEQILQYYYPGVKVEG